MKTLKLILSTLLLIALLNSCEKKENNPFIGSWENTEITTLGSVVATMTFRSDMTMTFKMVVTVNSQNTTTSTDYTYSNTETELSVQEAGEPEETTDYMISGNSLVLSLGGMGLTTFTKI
ncbi:MAG TPA: hypothetical protein VMW32_10910 [Bacteroidales bacterium]|nr:hypothetical protein [Bacteroidales bacterium]